MKGIETNSYIPEQAYLYYSQDTVPKKGNQRSIFDGNTTFSSEEHDMIKKFRSYSAKHNYSLKPLWTDNMLLRFLYANNFKMSKTLTSVKDHTLWRETKLPVKVDDSLQQVLNSGLLYVHGRDSQFHPIVVFNFFMLDPKKIDVDLITRALTYWFEYVIDEWMLPGQIENWVFIADVKGLGVGMLLHPSTRKVFTYLQDNYKCRLYKLFILNVTPVLYYPWKIIKGFLDEVTVQKVQICSGTVPTGLLEFANPEQVEQKYGGSAPNLTSYWPPKRPSNNYFVSPRDSDALITREEYISLYKKGQLNNMRINKLITEEKVEVEYKSLEITPSQTLSPQRLSNQDTVNVASITNPVIFEENYTIEQLYTPNTSKSSEDEQNDIYKSDDADYIDYMSESVKTISIKNNIKEFQASFLSQTSFNKIKSITEVSIKMVY